MKLGTKLVLLESFFFFGFPLIAGGLILALNVGGAFIAAMLLFLWGWELFASIHYRYCRQQEFLHVLQTAAETNAPVETVLEAYLIGRPTEQAYRFLLLFFVFPGFYWIHRMRSFDARITELAVLLERGVPLNRALVHVPGLVTPQTAMAINVGHFTGKLDHALNKLPNSSLAPQWLELGPKVLYPIFVLTVMINIVAFIMIFIIPKFEKIFLEFRLKLPFETELLISISRHSIKFGFLLPLVGLGLLALANILILSSRARWYFPLLGKLYRMHARGQFLQTLGLMLETGKPLPQVMDCVLESGLLPSVIAWRAEALALDLYRGEPLAESLAFHGLATPEAQGLIASAEKANHLPWALQEIGDSLVRRSARLAHRIALIAFPIAIVVCAGLVGFVAVSMFSPLTSILEKLGEK